MIALAGDHPINFIVKGFLVELRIPMNHYLVCVDPERPVESDNILMVLSRDVWFDLVLRRKVGNPYLPFNW